MMTMNTFPAGDPSLRRTCVLWFQMYDELTRFHLFGFDSGFFGSDEVDEVAVDGGGMDPDVEGSGFTQQLARVLLTFFLGGIVCVWEGGMRILCFFYCSMLVLQKPLHMETRDDALLLDASCFVFANNRIIGSEHPYSYLRIWQEPYSNPPYIQFVYSRIAK